MAFTAQQFAERMPDAREGEHYGNTNRPSGNATGPSKQSGGPRHLAQRLRELGIDLDDE